MGEINNTFTDLFDALLASPYDGLIIYSDAVPNFWKARYKGPVPGFEPMGFEEFENDLESLGIMNPMKGSETYKFFDIEKDEKLFTFYDHIQDDGKTVRLRIRYTMWGSAIRLTVYRPGISIPL